MGRLDLLFTGIALVFLAAIFYFYWELGGLKRWLQELRRRRNRWG